MSAYKEIFRPIIIVALCVLIPSCANQRKAPLIDKTFTFSTSSCEGSCPVFTIAFSENGRAVFSGYQHTRFIGDTTYRYNGSQTAQLFEILDRIDFAELEATYMNTLYDLPEIKMTYRGNSIIYNDDRIIPPSLRDLSAEVKRLLESTGLVE